LGTGTAISSSLIERAATVFAQVTDQTEPAASAEEAPVSISVNQIGYDTTGEKTLLLQILDSHLEDPSRVFQLVDEAGGVRFTGKLTSQGRMNSGGASDWGARYWSGEFSRFKASGTFRARLKVGTQSYFSFPFRIDRNLIISETLMPAVQFFRLQRCGFAVPGLHPACHMDDARISGVVGTDHRDATGGWHDAGDFNKYTGIACRTVYALLKAAHQASVAGLTDETRQQMIEEGLWGAEWLLKMWQPGKGIVYQDVWNGYDYWGTPDKETDNLKNTADDRPLRGEGPSAMSAGALALAARLTGKSTYLEAAEDLWRGAVESGPDYPEEAWITTSGGLPNRDETASGKRVRRIADLLLADTELEALTENRRYVENAQSCVELLAQQQREDGLWPSDTYSRIVLQGVPAAALALFVRRHPTSRSAAIAIKGLRHWLERNIQLTTNPFQLIPWANGVFLNPDIGLWWYTGQNSQYLSNAWALHLVAEVLNEPEARQLADRQIDWILGLNPYNLCMMEGKGSSNPPFYLHRWAPNEQRGAVPGAIPNGFCRQFAEVDIPWFDIRRPPRTVSYHTSEPWEPHNAFFILAVTARTQGRA
jgi:hypothetical protein